jgi:hypothetical protein
MTRQLSQRGAGKALSNDDKDVCAWMSSWDVYYFQPIF